MGLENNFLRINVTMTTNGKPAAEVLLKGERELIVHVFETKDQLCRFIKLAMGAKCI